MSENPLLVVMKTFITVMVTYLASGLPGIVKRWFTLGVLSSVIYNVTILYLSTSPQKKKAVKIIANCFNQ